MRNYAGLIAIILGLSLFSTPAHAGTGRITASPSPCVITDGPVCSTTLSWSTSAAPSACILIRETGQLFGCATSGTKTVTWITSSGYTFDLHMNSNPGSLLLSSVYVSGRNPTGTMSINPNPCLLGTSETCTVTVTWNTPDAPAACVFVGTSVFGCAQSASETATWITSVATTFDLRGANDPNAALIIEKTVAGREPNGSISASPAPCYISVGNTCTETVTWQSESPSACVYNDSGVLFGCAQNASEAATWVGLTPVMLTLRKSQSPSAYAMGSVTVSAQWGTGSFATHSALCGFTSGNTCSVQLSWSSPNLPGTCIFLQGATQALACANGYSGSANVAGVTQAGVTVLLQGSSNPNSRVLDTISPHGADFLLDSRQTGAVLPRLWNGGNASYIESEFSTTLGGQVGVNVPTNWMVNLFPSLSYVRFGNFIYGACGTNPINEEMLTVDGSGNYVTHFDQVDGDVANVLASGVKPQITLTGTPNLIATNPGACSNYDSNNTPPAAGDLFVWQSNVVGNLVQNLADNFGGMSAISGWRWATWTEIDSDNAGQHFLGSQADAENLIAASKNVFSFDGVPLRLGNIIVESDTGWFDQLLTDLPARGNPINVGADLPGIGVSLYRGGGDDETMSNALVSLQGVLTKHGLGGLPVYVDEFGSQSTENYSGKGAATVPDFQQGPDLHGAADMALDLKRILNSSLNIAGINIWHLDLYLHEGQNYLDLPGYVKLPNFNALDMLDQLRGQSHILGVDSNRFGYSTAHHMEMLATYGSGADRYSALLIHQANDYTIISSNTEHVCFGPLQSGDYYLEQYGMDTTRGSVWEQYVMQGADYRANRVDKSDPTPLLVAPVTVASLQTEDSYYLFSSGRITAAPDGFACQDFPIEANSVQLLRLTRAPVHDVTLPVSLSFETDLRTASGDSPVAGSGVSFDRGVDTSAPASIDYANGIPGTSWANYNGTSGLLGIGSEQYRGARFNANDYLVYGNRQFLAGQSQVKFWVRPDWQGSSGATGNNYVLSWKPDASDGLDVYFANQQQLVVQFTVGGTAYQATYSVAAWKARDWHYMQVSWDSSTGHVDLTVNGTPVGSLDGVPLSGLVGASGQVSIGNDAGRVSGLQGVLDEFSF